MIAQAPDSSRLYRYGATPPVRGTTGDVEALALYAGQSTGIVTESRPAAEIVHELAHRASAALGIVHVYGETRIAA